MRRLLVLLAGLGVLPVAAGCQHTAGYCDCEPARHPCSQYGLHVSDIPAGQAAATAAVTAHGAVKETPAPATVPVTERLNLPRGGF